MSSDEVKTNNYDVYESFDDMDLNISLLRGIYNMGFEKPSAIQTKAIIPLSQGKDIIAQSQSGTGKTATFSIGMLQRIDCSINMPQTIVLAPTRDLAKQIGKVVETLGKFMKNLNVHVSIGGERGERYSKSKQIKAQIIVGTPGRTFQYLENGAICVDKIKTVVLDEADQMLSDDFKEQIYSILRVVSDSNDDVQIGLYSATMPRNMLELSKTFMPNPIRILVKQDELTLDGIRQFYVDVERNEYKLRVVVDLYKSISVTQCIIYCNRVKTVNYLLKRLREMDYTVAGLHGKMEQYERNKILKEFRSGKERILITTDVLARGIDIQQISLVINYDLPFEKETYIHRIGRSGRFGRKGLAINFITTFEKRKLDEIQEFYSTHIEELPSNYDELLY